MDELEQLRWLSGIKNKSVMTEYKGYQGSNISVTATEKKELERKHNIRPGTQEWFRLWFSLPYLTGETPIKEK
jgi:hypothetical protein